MIFRIGNGFDVHCLVEGRPLIIGGVEIPYHRGLDGHSDADVLLHAICDALLGAAAMGDIGLHFPTSDEAWRAANSRVFLTHTVGLLHQASWKIENVDATIVAEKPTMKPYIMGMREIIANDIKIDLDAVSVKATTTDGAGFCGREEGIAVWASTLISKLA